MADSLRCVLVDVQRLVAEEDSQFSSKVSVSMLNDSISVSVSSCKV